SHSASAQRGHDSVPPGQVGTRRKPRSVLCVYRTGWGSGLRRSRWLGVGDGRLVWAGGHTRRTRESRNALAAKSTLFGYWDQKVRTMNHRPEASFGARWRTGYHHNRAYNDSAAKPTE